MGKKVSNYLQRKTYNFEILYKYFFFFRAAEEEARRNAAKAFNDRVENLGVTLSEFEKHIIKV